MGNPLANSAQARKRAKQASRHRTHNVPLRSRARTAVKKTLKALHQGDVAAAQAAFREAVPVIDRMADKGLMHKNKAARHKSRLNARIKALA